MNIIYRKDYNMEITHNGDPNTDAGFTHIKSKDRDENTIMICNFRNHYHYDNGILYTNVNGVGSVHKAGTGIGAGSFLANSSEIRYGWYTRYLDFMPIEFMVDMAHG